MLKVGVTGGIGSGKSLVCSVISAMGYPTFNSDIEARLIVENDKAVISSIKNLFGENIYSKNKLNRKGLAELVFSNKDLLTQLNQIIHPAVENCFNSWSEIHRNCNLVFMEAAIIFESGAYRYLDKVIGVTAPLEIKIDRIIKRDNCIKESINKRIENQIADEELLNKCDFIIYNDNKQLIVPQVDKIINSLLNSR